MLVRRYKGKKKTTLEDVMPKPVFQPEKEEVENTPVFETKPEQEEVENNEMVDNNEQEASEKKSKSKKGRK